MEQFDEREENEGVRWNWSKFPGTKTAAESMVSLCDACIFLLPFLF